MANSPLAEGTALHPTRIGELPAYEGTIALATPCREVFSMFGATSAVPGVVVVDTDASIKGLISRQRFMEVFSQPYRKEVYFGRSLKLLLDEEFAPPLCVSADEPIAQGADAASKRERHLFHEPIAVDHGNGVYRILEVQRLLHALADMYAFQFRELQAAKDSLVQAEKLASLGGLVAGVAHEINTPIGVSLSAASYLCEQIDIFAKLVETQKVRKTDLNGMIENSREASGIILQNMERAASLVRSFKQVAADQTSENRRQFDLRQSVSEILNSLSPSFKHTNIELRCEVDEGIAMDCYPGALAQIISNLVLNALIHAFGEEGRGSIVVSGSVLPGTQDVEMVIKDNGRGVPPEILGRIFDPFFTTRRNQGGTGLGLHIVHNLVHNTLGGNITVDSKQQVGTWFSVRIPQVAPTSSVADDDYSG